MLCERRITFYGFNRCSSSWNTASIVDLWDVITEFNKSLGLPSMQNNSQGIRANSCRHWTVTNLIYMYDMHEKLRPMLCTWLIADCDNRRNVERPRGHDLVLDSRHFIERVHVVDRVDQNERITRTDGQLSHRYVKDKQTNSGLLGLTFGDPTWWETRRRRVTTNPCSPTLLSYAAICVSDNTFTIWNGFCRINTIRSELSPLWIVCRSKWDNYSWD